jgi:hypothetical protein
MNIFLIEDFFHLPPVLLTPVVDLELQISPQIFEKLLNGPNDIIKGLGETDPCRKKSRETVPLSPNAGFSVTTTKKLYTPGCSIIHTTLSDLRLKGLYLSGLRNFPLV